MLAPEGALQEEKRLEQERRQHAAALNDGVRVMAPCPCMAPKLRSNTQLHGLVHDLQPLATATLDKSRFGALEALLNKSEMYSTFLFERINQVRHAAAGTGWEAKLQSSIFGRVYMGEHGDCQHHCMLTLLWYQVEVAKADAAPSATAPKPPTGKGKAAGGKKRTRKGAVKDAEEAAPSDAGLNPTQVTNSITLFDQHQGDVPLIIGDEHIGTHGMHGMQDTV